MIFEIFNKMKKIFIKRVHSFLENIYSCKKFSSFLQKFASIVDDFAITYRSKILLSQPHFYLLLFSLSLSSFCVSLVSLLRSYLPFFFFFPILFFPPSIRSTFEILNPVATPRGRMWNVREESSMTRNESSPRSGTEATTEIEATCFLRGEMDFVDKHPTIHFAERKRNRETWISFSCVFSSTWPIAYVYPHHSKTRDDDLRFRGGFFRLDRTGRCALMNVSNWWTINKRDSFADVYRDIINFSGRHQKFLTKFSVKRID